MRATTSTLPRSSHRFDALSYFKPTKRLRQYFMLEALAHEDALLTQRGLGQQAGLSPAVVNQYLLEFLQQGLVERTPRNRRDFAYRLTPKGEALRRELMVAYIRETFQMFQSGKEELAQVLREHQRRYRFRRVLFYSAGQVTEVLIQALSETTLELLAVVDDDPRKQGRPFYGYPVIGPEEIPHYEPDAVLITTFRYRREILERLRPLNLEAQGIRVVEF